MKLTDAALGRVLADLDHLVMPSPETVRSIAEELRETRGACDRLITVLNALGVAADRAANELKTALKEAADAP